LCSDQKGGTRQTTVDHSKSIRRGPCFGQAASELPGHATARRGTRQRALRPASPPAVEGGTGGDEVGQRNTQCLELPIRKEYGR
jgi:hypothetical protein